MIDTILACPLTKQPLKRLSLESAEQEMNAGKPLQARRTHGTEEAATGRTSEVLMRSDGQVAYPIVDGIPILLGPEALFADGVEPPPSDLLLPQYAEAYAEMDHYNKQASTEAKNIVESESFEAIRSVLRAEVGEKDVPSFPNPWRVWIDAPYDLQAQYEAYNFLAPVLGKTILQLGGKGIHAVKMLMAGAKRATALSPMLGEIRCAVALAEAVGVAERLDGVVGVAEELPFRDRSFDRLYSGGCLHHMVTDIAFGEAARILAAGGRFAAVDPWRAPLYAIGTKVFGKREREVFCRPLTKERVSSLGKHFQPAEVSLHGALLRYPLLALDKLGIRVSKNALWQLSAADDAIAGSLFLRRFGSSASVCGEVQ
jgi:uncharacterized protein YbaR (Trm112 family)/SAM-dependent methyltransferase